MFRAAGKVMRQYIARRAGRGRGSGAPPLGGVCFADLDFSGVAAWAEDAQAEIFHINLLFSANIKVFLLLTEATDVASVASMFLTSSDVMQTQFNTQLQNLKEQYDDFYKFFVKTIDEILSIWNDNDSYGYGIAMTSKDKWRFPFTKEYFKDRLFWWKERNTTIYDEGVKEVIQRQNIAQIAQTKAVRKPGLRLARSIEK
jgi:hypothetical protein